MSLPAELMPKLDKYELLEEVGHGGMATVYRAHDRRLGRDVAVKVIHRHLRESVEVGARFVSEARAVAKLRHPNIVEVYDVSDEDDPERYLVVELVRGTTLRKLLNNTGHMPAEIAAAVALEIAAALEHAHQQGVVHRDVKPENVLVDLPEEGVDTRRSSERSTEGGVTRIKITDFGIAKLLDAQGVTSTGQVLGSPAHMAPEQIEGGEVDARADVFGLGVLFYECLVGKLPFDGRNPAQVLRRVLDGIFTPADRARPTVGARFARIVHKALARDQEQRYESAAAMSEALRSELTRLGFDDPRRELAEYLEDPEAYRKEYEPRIMARLVDLGRRARSQREVTDAAAAYNRALAFRPDDADLLRQVAGLARAERLKRVAARVAVIVGGSALLGGVAYGVVRAARSKPAQGSPGLDGAHGRGGAAKKEYHPLDSLPRIKADIAKPGTSASAPHPRSPHPARTVLHVPTAPTATKGTGQVRVVIRGATGGTVRIDNGPAESPFGKMYSLAAGKHRLDFVPPNADCCETPKPKFFTVVADKQQTEYGEIPFKDATLQATGPAGMVLTCGELFPGKLTAPGSRTITMNGPRLSATCTKFPPPGSTDEPKPIDVHLAPGRTFPISWP
jgi:serine/threonine-protein kinase